MNNHRCVVNCNRAIASRINKNVRDMKNYVNIAELFATAVTTELII